jgi:uncharacterized NAD-dependent epimerase/dehydratase family protein
MLYIYMCVCVFVVGTTNRVGKTNQENELNE